MHHFRVCQYLNCVSQPIKSMIEKALIRLLVTCGMDDAGTDIGCRNLS